MCGICGAVSSNFITESHLKNMTDTIKYRGPDSEGYYIDISKSGIQTCLGHRRLSIFDLSALGNQPMESKDGKVIVVYNGEIYNFKSIRSELIEKGYTFKSECDTEVIIYGYKEWGIKFVNKINGMFSISIYDKEKEEVYLIRDRMGIKPLYYYYNGKDFAFASELKPIMKYPFFHKEIDMEALQSYFIYHYIPAPQTIFKNTYKLKPGEILKYDNNKNALTIETYWDLLEKSNNRIVRYDLSFQEHRNTLEKTLTEAVNDRMIADVPVGLFLSGGIDSSLITALAQKNSQDKVNTFTIGFEEDDFNEAGFARQVAERLGTRHTELYCTVNDAKKLLDEVPLFYDEPFADGSMLPSMLLSNLAKKSVTVALSGDGGDEVFCGYNMYDYLLMQRKLLFLGKINNHIIKPHILRGNLSWKIGKIINATTEKEIVAIDYMNTLDLINFYPIQGNYKEKLQSVYDQLTYGNIQEKRMIIDSLTYLPDDILTKVDRASMRYSLEARVPILDYRVVKNSLTIPHNYKYHKGIKKYILKQILYQYLPEDFFQRRKKGFSIPLNRWLHSDLFPLIDNLLSVEKLERQGIFNIDKVQIFKHQFEKKNSMILDKIMWAMIIFQKWFDEYMNE